MRSAATTLVALALASPLRADSYPRQPGIDVVHYVFRLTLSDDSDAIEAEATIDVRVAEAGVEELALDLVSTDASEPSRGMTVWGVSEDGSPLAHEHAGDRLTIRLAGPGKLGERRRIAVRYGGVPATGLIVGPTRHGERSFFSDNWPNKARHWLPTVDHPYDKATGELIVDAPAHYQVVSNGLLVEESDLPGGLRRSHWRQSVPIATWLYALGAARFAVDHRPAWRGRPIQTWVYRQDRETGFRVFAEPTVAALDFFASRVGPYSYEKLAQIQASSVGGGMESATAIFYGEESATGEQPARWRNVIIHEIAHQWFGNSVTENDWDDVWLSEGFATYFTLLFVEHAYGRDEFARDLRASRERIWTFDAEHPGYRIVHDQLDDMSQVLTGQIYQKGAWTLHMLRGLIGDEDFWSGIREYYARYRDGNASTADFRRVMEDASGRELDWFFGQWLYRGGLPRLRGEWRYDADEGALVVELEQTHEGQPYRLPLDIGIRPVGGSTSRVERIELRERRGVFSIASDRPPEELLFDPDTWSVAPLAVSRR